MLDRLKHLLVDVRSGGQLHDLEVHAALSQCVPQLQRFRQGLAVGEAHRGKDHVRRALRGLAAFPFAQILPDGFPKQTYEAPKYSDACRDVDEQERIDEVGVAVVTRGIFGHRARGLPLAEHDCHTDE